MAKLFPNKLLRNTMAKMCGSTNEGRNNMLDMLGDYYKDELCHLMYLGFSGVIPEIREIKINCPVLLTIGENDKIGKVRKYNELWNERDGHPLYIIKNAAHNANVDQPEKMNLIIEQFVKEIL